MQSKVVVLKSLTSFLSQAIPFAWRSREPQGTSGPTLTTPTWYLSSSFASTSAFNCFDALLVPTLAQTGAGPSWHWSQELDDSEGEDFAGSYSLAGAPCSAELSLQDLSDVSTLIAAIQEEGRSGLGTDAEVSCVAVRPFGFGIPAQLHIHDLTILQNLARTLHSTLVATFLDCAPSVFSPSTTPPETELQMVLVVCQLCRSLYGRILQDSAEVCSYSIMYRHTYEQLPSQEPYMSTQQKTYRQSFRTSPPISRSPAVVPLQCDVISRPSKHSKTSI